MEHVPTHHDNAPVGAYAYLLIMELDQNDLKSQTYLDFALLR